MKFRRIVFILIIATVIVAFFTNPKEAGFNTYIQPQLRNKTTGPVIEYKNNFLYSNARVTYFSPITTNGKTVASAASENYIGVFGRFWKMNN